MSTRLIPGPPGGLSIPKVTISASGVAAYTFTLQTTGWTWTSSDQPKTQPYTDQDLPILNNGAVTIIDGTQSFKFASMSQELATNSTKFTVAGLAEQVVYFTVEDHTATSTVYYIQNVKSKLYLQAGHDGSVTQQPYAHATSGFQWRFIDLGNSVYRIFSVGTGELLYTKTATSKAVLAVGMNPGGTAAVDWILDGQYFRAVSDNNLVWDVQSGLTTAGTAIQLFEDKGHANQQFVLVTQEPA